MRKVKHAGPYFVFDAIYETSEELDNLCEASGLNKVYTLLKKSNFEKKSGFKIPANAAPLGSGTRGMAFDIGGGKILKITNDASEARASSAIIGKKLRGIWQVFDVRRTWEDGLLYGYYFIIGEKLKHNVSRAQEIRKEFGGGSGDSDLWKEPRFKNYIEDAEPDFKEIAYGLRNLNKLGISWKDMKLGNIMFRGNKPVIIDLGYSYGGTEKIRNF